MFPRSATGRSSLARRAAPAVGRAPRRGSHERPRRRTATSGPTTPTSPTPTPTPPASRTPRSCACGATIRSAGGPRTTPAGAASGPSPATPTCCTSAATSTRSPAPPGIRLEEMDAEETAARRTMMELDPPEHTGVPPAGVQAVQPARGVRLRAGDPHARPRRHRRRAGRRRVASTSSTASPSSCRCGCSARCSACPTRTGRGSSSRATPCSATPIPSSRRTPSGSSTPTSSG